jgi:hypothetical protein
MSHPEIGVFRDVVVLIPELAGEPGDAGRTHFPRLWTAVVIVEAPNGWALSSEPSERSERPDRKRGRRVRCNAMFDGMRYRPGTWLTDWTGYMVDSLAQHGAPEGVLDALERDTPSSRPYPDRLPQHEDELKLHGARFN